VSESLTKLANVGSVRGIYQHITKNCDPK